jgi:glycerophosphoryl diester phosphodiesterase
MFPARRRFRARLESIHAIDMEASSAASLRLARFAASRINPAEMSMSAAWLKRILIAVPLLMTGAHSAWSGSHSDDGSSSRDGSGQAVQLGVRPYYLIEGMDDSRLKRRLQSCANGPFRKTDFSIAHRGAPLQFPEHTRESYEAGARQGAGIVECDVTFTKDGELVCRHAECDLHTTTNIVGIPELN